MWFSGESHSWALDSIRAVTAAEIMGDVGSGRFAPGGPYRVP